MSKLIITKRTPVVEKCCKSCLLKTDIELCPDCGECADPGRGGCCECEEEDPYLCVDCGKDFKWKSGTSSAGAGVNSYHCGSCGEKAWAWFNKQEEEEAAAAYRNR